MKFSFANLKISTRLWLMLGMGSVAIFATVLWLVMDKRTAVMEEKRAATRHVVEVAVGTLARFEAEVKAGTLSLAEAQRLGILAVKGMRYEGDEYLWINDMNTVMVMHPVKPELDGKGLAEFKDPNGKALFVAFVETVRVRGGGFVDYLWPKPGAADPQPKISYVKGFAPWGWVIGSGIYVDDARGSVLARHPDDCSGRGHRCPVLRRAVLPMIRGISRSLREAIALPTRSRRAISRSPS